MDESWTDHLLRLREERLQASLHRTLPALQDTDGRTVTLDGRRLVNFSSNDYLGYSRRPELLEAATAAAKRWGNGSTGSRLMSGNYPLLAELEHRLSRLLSCEAALVFPSGWSANLAILSSLADNRTTVLCDRLDHASIYDGIRLSGAELARYRHADPADLARRLASIPPDRRVLVVTDSVFSMDGDPAPLADILRLRERRPFLLVVDEAHGLGVYGRDGAGLLDHLGLAGRADIVMATFGKSLGASGAVVASSRLVIDHLVNTARPFIFTTALPPFSAGAALAGLDLLRTEQPGPRLLEKARRLRSLLGLPEQDFASPIIPVVAGSNERAIGLRDHLRAYGCFVQAVRPPTVPPGTARIRVSLSLLHTDQDLELLAKAVLAFFEGPPCPAS